MNQVESAPERSVERQPSSAGGPDRSIGRRTFLKTLAVGALSLASLQTPLGEAITRQRPALAQGLDDSPVTPGSNDQSVNSESVVAVNPNSPQNEALPAPEKKTIYDWDSLKESLKRLRETGKDTRIVEDKLDKIEELFEERGNYSSNLINLTESTRDDPSSVLALVERRLGAMKDFIDPRSTLPWYYDKKNLDQEFAQIDKLTRAWEQSVSVGDYNNLMVLTATLAKKYPTFPKNPERYQLTGELNIKVLNGNNNTEAERDKEKIRYLASKIGFGSLPHEIRLTSSRYGGVKVPANPQNPRALGSVTIKRDPQNAAYYEITLDMDDNPNIALSVDLIIAHELGTASFHKYPYHNTNAMRTGYKRTGYNEVLRPYLTENQYFEWSRKVMSHFDRGGLLHVDMTVSGLLSEKPASRGDKYLIRDRNDQISWAQFNAIATEYGRNVLISNLEKYFGGPEYGQMGGIEQEILELAKKYPDLKNRVLLWVNSNNIPKEPNQDDNDILRSMVLNGLWAGDDEVRNRLADQQKIEYSEFFNLLIDRFEGETWEDGVGFAYVLGSRLPDQPPILSDLQQLSLLVAQRVN